MGDFKNELGVQSYCFRGLKEIPALLAEIRAIGVSRCELCGVHADFDDRLAFDGVIRQFQAAGVAITSIGVQMFRGDPAEEKWFAAARAAGAKMISANFDVSRMPGVFAWVEKLAEKYDLRLGIHNHGGYAWLGNSDMLRHVLNVTGERIGLCVDSAWCLQAGEDPVKWAREFSGRLYGVHIKDFVFDQAGKWTDVVVGTGNLKLKEFLQACAEAPRLEAITLEYEGDVENPGPALRECVAAMRGAMQLTRGHGEGVKG